MGSLITYEFHPIPKDRRVRIAYTTPSKKVSKSYTIDNETIKGERLPIRLKKPSSGSELSKRQGYEAQWGK